MLKYPSVFKEENDGGGEKAAVLGDYQLAFGQGLTLWSGMSFGKAGAPISATFALHV